MRAVIRTESLLFFVKSMRMSLRFRNVTGDLASARACSHALYWTIQNGGRCLSPNAGEALDGMAMLFWSGGT
jgi:hypothetical protein